MLKLGKLTGLSARRQGSRRKGSEQLASLTTRGCRKKGGGRGNRCLKFFKQVALFHHTRRKLCQAVDEVDCYNEFCDQVELEVKAWKILEGMSRLSVARKQYVDMLEGRLKKLREKRSYRESFTRRLCAFSEV